MAWLSRVNFTASDVLSYTDVNNLGNDIRAWGGNVNAGGYTLSNVVLELLNISGGSSSSSVLTLLSTTGTGTTDSIVFKTGSQVQRMKITSAGVIVIGSADDLSISRNAAGVLQVGDGGANANGQITALAFNSSNSGSLFSAGAASTYSYIGTDSNNALLFRINVSEKMRLATSGNLLIGTTTDDGSNKLQVSGSARVLSAGTAALKVDGGTTQGQWVTGTGFSSIGTVTNDPLVFYTNNVNAARFSGSGNFLIGTSADDGFNKLQVSGPVAVNSGSLSVGNGYGLVGSGNSLALVYTAGQIEFRSPAAARLMTFGSTGVISIYNETATTGVTKAVIRAGAGQSATNLQEWQNSGGGVITYIANTGDIVSTASIQSPFFLGADNSAAYIVLRGAGGASAFAGLSRGQSQFAVFSDYKIGFLSGTNVNATTTSADTAIARNAAGVLEINNGTAGTYRDLILRRSQHNGVTVAALPAAAAGNAGSIQYVTDANATTIGSTVVGGGANKVMVWSDGAAWKIFAS